MRKPSFISRVIAVALTATLLPAGGWGQAQSQSAPAPQAAAPRASETKKLPVRRVVLYKNGVGYFEHLGRVRGSQDVSIDFTSGQLNDVLKSLTTLDLGGGRITGVNYNSDAPLSRRLAALRLPLGEQTTRAAFLGAMRGARLEVRTGTASFTGRMLSVETRTQTRGDVEIPVDELSVVTAAGDVRTVELTPSVSVRLAEPELAAEAERYFDLLASTREKDLRRMTISATGTGERPLYVSYISEVPIWKTTYRVVLPSKPGAKPLLQGWAIVDNTVGEDWEGVELSLVAGAPQSFIQQLSQPYYSRRPVVPLPESVMLTPQTHQATLAPGTGSLVGELTDASGAYIAGATVRVYDVNTNSVVAQTVSDEYGDYEITGLPAGNYRVEYERPGFQKSVFGNVAINVGKETNNSLQLQVGAATETVRVEAGASRTMVSQPPPATPYRGWLNRDVSYLTTDEARGRLEAAAQARELGDLFEYKLKEPVTIRKNQSAMVPIVQTEIAAEKVSLWNESTDTARPLRALWLTNSSALTLDGGSFSVLEDETFAGEGLTEALKPGEKRLLSYAVDLGVQVDAKLEGEQGRVTRVRISRGVMFQSSEEHQTKAYTIRNEDTSSRNVVIEHPVRQGWKRAAGGPEPAETSATHYRFRVTVEPKKTSTLTVAEVRPLSTSFQISSVTDEQIKLFVTQRSINPQVEAALRRILEQKGVVAGFQSQAAARQRQVQSIFEDQKRVRENRMALKDSAEEKALVQLYVTQLREQERQLDALRAEMAQLEEKRKAAQEELNRMIEQLSMDVTL